MITTVIALAAVAAWAGIATLETLARDGYGRVPTLALLYYPLP